MPAFEIERQTDQTPLTRRSPQAAQGELAKAQDFLADPNHRLDGAFPQTIDCFSDLGLQLVGHLFFGSGFFPWRFGQGGAEGAPILMIRQAASSIIFKLAPLEKNYLIFPFIS